jgi:hypothetical protein
VDFFIFFGNFVDFFIFVEIFLFFLGVRGFFIFLVTSVVLFNIGPRNTESNKRFIRFGHETEAEPY